ncbi:ATP-grasp domain-containing protein [Paenibacillus sp. BSR1-1]|uniref:ATP-grasp domain-containing protein n=1 Tax=Paenibacillus sp. BSR1-1 TaxID=3020845 RepID=UPI0025B0DB26|nr:ATP-grasp domain-containing protein [Paenibacillus sp. BSR1-1]MDN3015340.1 ATP-grasp domain-containing protein [Paenibacillus sp. BSR1-1]
MKIWFNRWFTTVSHYMDLIRANNEGRKFLIYGTHPNKDALYLQNCDYAFIEPEVSGDEYIAFCLDFCQWHGIDIFIPRKENVLISKRLAEFEAIGVKVLVCPDADLMETVDNKAATYQSIAQRVPSFLIPDYYVVNNIAGFKMAYESLKEKGHEVCFKPVTGEGANGFRVIKEEVDSIQQLFQHGIRFRMPYKYACEIFSQQESFPDLMVMEYLDGREYSIDCLASQDELYAAIPRMKGDGRVRELVESLELMNLARDFHEEYKLPYVFNIQMKYGNGVPKLLEINPRMSGGMHISCLSGINLPYQAIKILLGETLPPMTPKFGIRASHIEKEMILKVEDIS